MNLWLSWQKNSPFKAVILKSFCWTISTAFTSYIGATIIANTSRGILSFRFVTFYIFLHFILFRRKHRKFAISMYVISLKIKMNFISTSLTRCNVGNSVYRGLPAGVGASPQGYLRCPKQGSMLWSQFSAIFDNFRRKIWRFSQKPMLWSNFCII
jgi:hypothetical protein